MDGAFDEMGDVMVESRSDALALYGREIRIDACDWSDSKSGNNVCRQSYPNQGKECIFDAQGRPKNPSGDYTVFTTGGSSLLWGESTIYDTPRNGKGRPSMYCRQRDGLQAFSVTPGEAGTVMARIPGQYDNVVEGPVRGTVVFEPNFAIPHAISPRSSAFLSRLRIKARKARCFEGCET